MTPRQELEEIERLARELRERRVGYTTADRQKIEASRAILERVPRPMRLRSV